MKVRELMTNHVVRIGVEEPVEAAARAFTHYNIGVLPVCGADGRVCGMVTDRDVVTRCVASGRSTGTTKVKDVMTPRVVATAPDMDVSVAAHLMGRAQVRRLPVMENGRLCGMLSLADLTSTEEGGISAADALVEITANVTENIGKSEK